MPSKTACLFMILVGAALSAACAVGVNDPADPIADPPECNLSTLNTRWLITPEAVSSVDPALASEFDVRDCVEVENPGNYDPQRLQHMWCCQKVHTDAAAVAK